jgi:predicted metal-dependent hydrolase
MLYVTRNFIVDRTHGSLELLKQDGITGPRAWTRLFWFSFVRPGMMRKIAGAWLSFFLPRFHPWNVDDRHLLAAFDANSAGQPAGRTVRGAT